MPSGRRECAIDQRFDDAPLEARGKIDNFTVWQLRDAQLRLALSHVPQHRGLEAAKAEIKAAVALRSIAVGIGEACAGPADRGVVPVGREAVDDRSAGIAERQQLRDLVVGLAGRVIARAAEQLVFPFALDQIQARMAAGHDQHDRGQRDRSVLEPDRLDVAGEVVHGHERFIERPRCGFRERDPDEQRPDEPRPLRHRYRVDVAPAGAAIGQRALDDPADVADVLTRRQLRHHAAPLAVNVRLRSHHVRTQMPTRGPIFNQRRGRFVAGGFNPEDQHFRSQIADFSITRR